MTDKEQKKAAKEFAAYWKGKGYEKGQSQTFWLSLLHEVYGIEYPKEYIFFETQVHLDHTSFIDAVIPSTHVLIEQKSIGKDLRKGIKQSDGSFLNPFEQAKRYSSELPYSERPRWIVTSNFSSFLVYDMETPRGEPEEILLENLEKEYYRLSFLVEKKNEHLHKEMTISMQAGDIVGTLYNEILEQYKDPANEDSLKSLNMLCVRLVFCLYAEDAGIFGRKDMFHDYIEGYSVRDMRQALISLFRTLDTKEEERDPYMDDVLAEFPYVNGGLFSDENIEIPQFTEHIREVLLSKASEDFDWSEISPTIFGAVFESTLNPETRRSGGMHYTSIENIHKVIDPLFFDELREEFEQITEIKTLKTRKEKLETFHKKLASLKFLDPACGSGNFLTETYLSLRKLENKVIMDEISCKTMEGQIALGEESINPIQVSIGQFYGIEINDFAVSVAQTALWIAESQMMKETEELVHMQLDFLPLKSYCNIKEGNALRMDWQDVVPKEELSYIMGNPPFVGKKEQSGKQKTEIKEIFGKRISGVGNMDYVTGWYVKSSEYIKDTKICVAFVSTNSIQQGEQPPVLWTKLSQYNIKIIFAHRSFVWSNEARDKAHVHCVIIGFSTDRVMKESRIYTGTHYMKCKNINPYLLDAPTVIIKKRSKPLCDVPSMEYGSMPIDNNNLILDIMDVEDALKENPDNKKFIKEYVGGKEILNKEKRWCLWLDGINPTEFMKSKFIMGRIRANEHYRRYESGRVQTNKLADTPHLFGEIRQPKNGALVIPKVSSEDRYYIPITFIDSDVIISGSALMIPEATLYHFGILSSNVHNAWMRMVAGRMKSDYQYSAQIVYNNFPWPEVSEIQKRQIEEAAKRVLDIRKKYDNLTLASMYKQDNYTLLGDLRKAHRILDHFVLSAYGITKENPAYKSESDCVAELMKRYQKLAEEKDK